MIEITVVGAGLAGLTAALRLTERGYPVRVHERYPGAGGLARTVTIGGEPLEVFYHHIFTSDTAYVRLAQELGLDREIEWLPSRMGIWTGGRLWDFGTPGSLLRFRPLGLLDKVRFVTSTLRLQRATDAAPFEDVPASQWIRRHQGERVWESIWGPLFHQKFDRYADQVAMVWLWRKLYLRGRSRTRSGMGERLGYMRGSFDRLTSALVDRVRGQGGTLHTGDPVQRIERDGDGFTVHTRSGRHRADLVLVAAPVP
ncbi:MAG TPA: FAD-dependent oxidoreductase, partial [Acidobacteria bacterium]|nr:FAD-dependent oxidoreductase [Acidobacteriota bacterium]